MCCTIIYRRILDFVRDRNVRMCILLIHLFFIDFWRVQTHNTIDIKLTAAKQ